MILFLVGVVSLLAQVVLLRELNVAFYGVELAYLLALAAWLAGSAAGASLVPRVLRASLPRTRALLAAAALALPLVVAFIRRSRVLLGGVTGAYLPIEGQLLVLLASIVPLSFLFGLAFRWAAALHVGRDGRLATAYALECAGAAVGGLVSMLAFRAGVQTFAMTLATTTATLAAVAGRWSVTSVVIVAGVAALSFSGRIDTEMTRWTHPSLVESIDTPYARVTVARDASQVSVFENDVLAHESETAANEELPHLAALQHPSPTRMLLLGGSVELVDRELAKHRPAALVQVEMDAAMLAAVRRAIPAARSRAIVVADPRRFLMATRARADDPGNTFDLILVALPEPASGQANRFYTREFFDECAARLAPGGVLGLRLQLPENYLSPSALMKAASVTQALRSAFRDVEVIPASNAIVLASNRELPDATVLCDRCRDRALGNRLVTPAYIRYLYENDRRHELRAALASSDVPANRDAQPVAFLFAVIGWLSKFVPALVAGASVAAPARWPRAWVVAPFAILALGFAATRLFPGMRRGAIAAASGFAGMALESVVLLDYQAKNGALFEDLGWLVMAFMAGSTFGAWAASGARGSAAAVCRLLLLALSALAMLSGWMVAGGVRIGLGLATGWLFVTGSLVAAVFAAASVGLEQQGEGGMGRLYAADLLGGCVASIAASLLLIPLAGLDATAYVVAAVSGIAILATSR